jgi:hypothetical protein
MIPNEFEKKYKQMNLLGKGNYGTFLSIQERSTRPNSMTASKENKPNILWPRKCTSKVSPNKKSTQHSVRYC